MKSLRVLVRLLFIGVAAFSFSNLLWTETITIQTESETYVLDISDVEVIRFEGDVSAEDMEMLIPIMNAKLKQNYPNPFNPETTISFELENDSSENVQLTIFNAKGQKIKTLVNKPLFAGVHQEVWKGKDEAGKTVSSGIYFYQLNVNNQLSTKKMILLK